jgi:hypothetical protein
LEEEEEESEARVKILQVGEAGTAAAGANFLVVESFATLVPVVEA